MLAGVVTDHDTAASISDLQNCECTVDHDLQDVCVPQPYHIDQSRQALLCRGRSGPWCWVLR